MGLSELNRYEFNYGYTNKNSADMNTVVNFLFILSEPDLNPNPNPNKLYIFNNFYVLNFHLMVWIFKTRQICVLIPVLSFCPETDMGMNFKNSSNLCLNSSYNLILGFDFRLFQLLTFQLETLDLIQNI